MNVCKEIWSEPHALLRFLLYSTGEVPENYKESPKLVAWVSDQVCCFQLKRLIGLLATILIASTHILYNQRHHVQDYPDSTYMTEERYVALEALEFAWNGE